MKPGWPPAPNNLSQADRTKLQYMLMGTVHKPKEAPVAAPPPPAAGPTPGPAGPPLPAPAAAPAPDPNAERAAENRLHMIASSIRTAVGRKNVAAAIALIPATMDERREVDTVYKALYGETAYMALFTKLPGKQGQRAAALWYDERDDADRLALEAASDERDKANREADEIDNVAILAPVAKSRRKEGEEKVEAAIKQVAQSGDQGSVAGRAAGQEHLKKIIADPKGSLSKKIDIKSEGVAKAIADGDEAAELAARLARADETKDVSTDEVESTLRRLRQLATDAAEREIATQPEVFEPIADLMTKKKISDYYDRFVTAFNRQQKRRSFDLVVTGHGGTDEKAAKLLGVSVDDMREVAGKSSDVYRNKQLLANKGELPEWQEVFYALNRDPKDIERVRSILSSKTVTEVQQLSYEYMTHTGMRSLEVDLAGTDAEKAFAKIVGGEARENISDRQSMLAGGKWDRERALANVPGDLDDEGRQAHLLKAEGAFLSGKISALERRVIENRGYFARVRDWAGNEEKSILDLAGKDTTRASGALANALTPDRGTTWKPGEEGTPLRPNLTEAMRQVAELRRIEARMSHAVSIYKEATKKAYEEFVDLVVNAATIAAGLGVAGIWLTALRTTAATVGTKLLMKGSDYSVDEFIGDIEGGMAGVVGDFAKLGFKQFVAPYVASKILRFARRVGMSKEFYAQVQAHVGPLAMRQAEHTIGTGASNVVQGHDVTEGQGLGARVKGELIGQVTGPKDEKIRAGKATKAAAAAAKAETAGGSEEEAGPARKPDPEEASTTRPATGELDAPTRPANPHEVEGTSKPVATETAAGDADAGIPATPMALPEPAPAQAPRRKQAQPPPIPEAAKRPRPKAGTEAGADRFTPPVPDTNATTRARSDRTQTGPKPEASPASPHPLSGDEPVARSGHFEFPPGAVQLNAPGAARTGPPPIPGAPTKEQLEPRIRSEALRRKVDERLAQAQADVAKYAAHAAGSPIRDAVEASLRDAHSDYELAYGMRAPRPGELRRLNAKEWVADAEADIAEVRGAPGSPSRVAAEAEVAAATKARIDASVKMSQARRNVRSAEKDPDGSHMVMIAAASDLEVATKSMADADARVKDAKTRLRDVSKGWHAEDWQRRRAQISLKGAHRELDVAEGKVVPPPIPASEINKLPMHGPAQREGAEFEPAMWDRELVIQLQNKHSLEEHEKLLFAMLREDPTREVGFFRNSRTGEIIIVRGKEGTVTVQSGSDQTGSAGEQGPRGAGEVQRWKELLDTGSDQGGWELVAHSHPSQPGQRVHPLNRYPSGFTGDFSVLVSDAWRDKLAKTSTIYYLDNGIRQKTVFGFDPYDSHPYWFQLPGEEPMRFKSLDAYQDHVRKLMNFQGIHPDFKPVPADYPRA